MKTLKLNLLFFLYVTYNLTSSLCLNYDSNAITEVDIVNLKTGDYTHSSFQSKARGNVAFNVYLPPIWSKKNSSKYPLIILLHGQSESENTFIDAFPADSLNHWIKNKLIPEVVLIALRGGENTTNMQWYTDSNENMITSNEDGELRKYSNEKFNTSIKSSQISIIGHSRGATGALNFALNFPTKFSSIVSSAFVSDYAIERLKKAVDENHETIINSGIKIQMLIGSNDNSVLKHNRKGSSIISLYLKEKGIANELKIIEGKPHKLAKLWEYPTNLNYLKFCTKTWKKNSD